MEVTEKDGKYYVGPFDSHDDAASHIDQAPVASGDKLSIHERFDRMIAKLHEHGIHVEPQPASEPEPKEAA